MQYTCGCKDGSPGQELTKITITLREYYDLIAAEAELEQIKKGEGNEGNQS
jgi:hypothetical protein